ncbi:MAG: glycosyltransferase family 4 protein [Acidimicrobiales bacterium]|nr:glycosyltransferase family 4 protein [Acidimicrobiales bacterium]
MKIAVVCPHFAPDVAPTGEVMTRIVAELVARGHHVDLVTALPWYLHHRVEPGWEGRLVRSERTPWGRVRRVHPFPTDKTDIPRRALAFAGFTAVAAAVGCTGPRADAVLAMSPPLTLGAAGWLMGLARRAPLVFNIQDVFPDVAVELGVLHSPRVIAAARALERWCYARADAVTVLSDDLRDNVAAKVRPSLRAKVRVIPNFVDTDWIRPSPPDNGYRREYGLEGRTVVLYAGNVGFSQSLDLVLRAAAELRHDRPDVAFVVNGGGAALEGLRRAVAEQHLDNVVFAPLQPKERLPEVLAAGDLHLVPLRRGLARSSVPSKTYSILAAGRPLLASVDPGTEVARLVDRSGAGLAVPPDDPVAFTAALRRLLADPAGLAAMGSAGRRFVEGWASPAAVAQAYEALFEELAAGRRARRRR